MQGARDKWFLETTDMLRAALGPKPSPAEYRAVLCVLYEHMSDRNLAETVGEVFDFSPEQVLNDIYDVALRRDVSAEEQADVTRRLMVCGFATWATSE